MKTMKVELIPCRFEDTKFEVVKLTNTVEFKIGQVLTKDEVSSLIRRANSTVVVKPRPS